MGGVALRSELAFRRNVNSKFAHLMCFNPQSVASALNWRPCVCNFANLALSRLGDFVRIRVDVEFCYFSDIFLLILFINHRRYHTQIW